MTPAPDHDSRPPLADREAAPPSAAREFCLSFEDSTAGEYRLPAFSPSVTGAEVVHAGSCETVAAAYRGEDGSWGAYRPGLNGDPHFLDAWFTDWHAALAFACAVAISAAPRAWKDATLAVMTAIAEARGDRDE